MLASKEDPPETNVRESGLLIEKHDSWLTGLVPECGTTIAIGSTGGATDSPASAFEIVTAVLVVDGRLPWMKGTLVRRRRTEPDATDSHGEENQYH